MVSKNFTDNRDDQYEKGEQKDPLGKNSKSKVEFIVEGFFGKVVLRCHRA